MRVRRSWFTLIELLVVIAIIAVLAALLLPALASARIQAKKTKAKVQMKAMQTAIAMYESDFGVLPVSPPASYNTGTVPPDSWVVNFASSGMTGHSNKYEDLIEILQGANPRSKRYLDVQGAPGQYLDPWEQAYQVALDGNYDGDILSDDPGSTPTYPTGPVCDKNGNGTVDAGDVLFEQSAVWSSGKNRVNNRGLPDDVVSWGN